VKNLVKIANNRYSYIPCVQGNRFHHRVPSDNPLSFAEDLIELSVTVWVRGAREFLRKNSRVGSMKRREKEFFS